ncbi:hypothetical protein MTR67_025878 [Solanum verrucosum]|uniref:Tf2-1-like SH3-like domain-containing protein n=1 Tax=Solanum verrucosum TaxID=315347 RepID=A0AAF0R1Q4_SOLVR|nr:hypothetical protein MTR67_025878 [Solanum verrucosum]
MKGVMRFGKKGKLSPLYIGPYKISKRIGNVAYKLELPSDLAPVHPVFHIYMLKKYMGDLPLIIPIKNIRIKDNLSYKEILVQIYYRQVRKLRTKEVASVKSCDPTSTLWLCTDTALALSLLRTGHLQVAIDRHQLAIKAKEQGKDTTRHKGTKKQKKLKESKVGPCQSHSVSHRADLQLTQCSSMQAHGQDQLSEQMRSSATRRADRQC